MGKEINKPKRTELDGFARAICSEMDENCSFEMDGRTYKCPYYDEHFSDEDTELRCNTASFLSDLERELFEVIVMHRVYKCPIDHRLDN